MADSLFSFEAVRVVLDSRAVLRDVDLSVPAAGVTAVVGPSGAGKSTLLRLCNRLEVPDGGVVRYRGCDVASIPPRELRRRVGMVFQRAAVFGGTVADNLRVAAPAAPRGTLEDVLERSGLGPAFLDREAASLSGGEAQRMCIARALMTGPETLLLDEPTAALDPTARLGMEHLVRDLTQRGVPAVWVTHDLDQMGRVADHVVVLIGGRVRYTGGPGHLTGTGGRGTADDDVAAFLKGELK